MKCSYWIPENEYYRLRDFSRQYPKWEKHINSIEDFSGCTSYYISTNGEFSYDLLENQAFMLLELRKRVDAVKRALVNLDPEVKDFVFIGVTRGVNYEWLTNHYGLECGKDIYYDQFRKFYYNLSNIRKKNFS